jgi:hypothetical protein
MVTELASRKSKPRPSSLTVDYSEPVIVGVVELWPRAGASRPKSGRLREQRRARRECTDCSGPASRGGPMDPTRGFTASVR